MRTVAVIGMDVIGTSVALALSAQGLTVYLADDDPVAARTAASLGAGRLEEPPGTVDLVVLSVGPAAVGQVLAECQRRNLGAAYTDLTSVKLGPLRSAAAAACNLARFVGGHPVTEAMPRSGVSAARPDLFEGRPWVLSPTPDTDSVTLNAALELTSLCGAVPVVMEPAAHDRAIALVTQTPRLTAGLLAGRLEHSDPTALRIAGRDLRDTTRATGGDPQAHLDELRANAGAVVEVLRELAADLNGLIEGVGDLRSTDSDRRRSGARTVTDLLRRGNHGRGRIPGKHGAPPAACESVAVLINDQPGELARLLDDVARQGVNVEDLSIDHSLGQQLGWVHLVVPAPNAAALAAALDEKGWPVRH
ncbi:prephenate dehydrogenase [Kitasatospora sp. NPDC093102]|uniref:prephenate dehydrogenase n=1 Tax=Kitasatospora sp. NPDC093102 TaxID=3155069 RepID=UPI0034442EF8